MWTAYYYGKWIYKTVGNFFLKILVYIVVGCFTFGLFSILIPHFVKNLYGDYVLETFGGITVGIGLSFFVPYICFRC